MKTLGIISMASVIHRIRRINVLFPIFILFVGLLYDTRAFAQQPGRPVIFVPGVVGSILSDQAGNTVWGGVGSLNKSNFQQLDLLPRNGAAVHLEATDVVRDIPMVFGAYKIGVYSKLIDFLTGRRRILNFISGNEIVGNYREGQTLFVFPYDWRRTNFSNAKRLNDFIQSKVPSGEYDIIAHSMGGIITRIMLDGRSAGGVCEGTVATAIESDALSLTDLATVCNAVYGQPEDTKWPNTDFVGPHNVVERLHTYIELAVPHDGSNSALLTFIDGWGALSRVLAGGINSIQNVLVAMPTSVELVALYAKCCAIGKDGETGNEEVVSMERKLALDFWANKVLGFGQARCPYTNCRLKKHILAIGLSNRRVINDIMDSKIPASVKYFAAVVGRNVEGTLETHYLSRDAGGNGSGFSYRKNSDGDGTVHRLSALPPEYPNATILTANRTSHQFIIEDNGVQGQLHGLFINPIGAGILEVDDKVAKLFGEDLKSVGLEVSSQVVMPGEQVKLDLKTTFEYVAPSRLTLEKNAKLAVKLSQVQFATTEQVGELSFQPLRSLLSFREVVFSGELKIPNDPGVYKAEVFSLDSNVPISAIQFHVIDSE